MRIHCLTLVKNEGDVLEEVLTSALAWADAIYVFDNGSTDNSWEITNDLARKDSRIVPYVQDACAYDSGLLARIYNAFRNKAELGDWWCRLDADEVYIDEPQLFLKKIPLFFEWVVSSSFQYYFTDADWARWKEDPSLYDPGAPLSNLRYYRNDWGECRFVRHIPERPWTQAWPKLVRTRAFPIRIWLRHYQWRSPEQIKIRLSTRLKTEKGFLHEKTLWQKDHEDAFRQRIVKASACHYDRLDRRWQTDPHLMPPHENILSWSNLRNRIAKKAATATRLITGKRPDWTYAWYPPAVADNLRD